MSCGLATSFWQNMWERKNYIFFEVFVSFLVLINYHFSDSHTPQCIALGQLEHLLTHGWRELEVILKPARETLQEVQQSGLQKLLKRERGWEEQ